MAKLAVVVTAYNREDFVDTCLRSILEDLGQDQEITIFVMDNGSSDDTARVAARVDVDRVRVSSTKENQHVIAVINRGFDLAYQENPDYILLLNEDTQFTPGSLKRLLKACDAHPQSILTPMQINYRRPEHLDDAAFGHIQQVRPLLEDALLKRPLQEVYEIPTIIGAAMLAKAAVWKNCGEFDPLFWFYGVDDDICTRARFLGYQILIVPEAHLYHAHGKSGAQDNQPGSAKIAAAHRKWRNETQARYLFQLKNPSRSLPNAALHTGLYALYTSFTCLRGLWPAGILQALTIFLDCLRHYPRIQAARARHFDPAKKITP